MSDPVPNIEVTKDGQSPCVRWYRWPKVVAVLLLAVYVFDWIYWWFS